MKIQLLVVLFCVLSISAHPSLKKAGTCLAANCKIEDNCRCSSRINPINDKENPAPQVCLY